MLQTTQTEFTVKSEIPFNAYLATVVKVYSDEQSLNEYPLETDKDSIKVYNGNKNFSKINASLLGAITYNHESSIKEIIAHPFDKNTITYPLPGETVIILDIGYNHFWLPYSRTLYPNFRENWAVSELTKEREAPNSPAKKSDYKEVKETGTVNQKPIEQTSKKSEYEVKERVHFLKPKAGDTIITGRVGQSIRFSEFFLTEDDKSSSPAIFIRNKQNPELDNKAIGELVEEDINKDGSSIYVTS